MTGDLNDGSLFSPEILSYYQQGREAGRLFTSAQGQLEFLRTQDILRRLLPSPPATALDVGGGSGVYASVLGEAGYTVHLIDPVPLHVEQARQASEAQPARPIASSTVGDARALPFPDGCADAVLLLGPLYHLVEQADRQRALSEARRTLKPGGRVFAAGISRFAAAIDGVYRGEMLLDDEYWSLLQHSLATGRHRNPSGRRGLFTTAYFHRPADLAAEVEEAGFANMRLLAIEGAVRFAGDMADRWDQDPVYRERVLQLLRQFENDPSLIGFSGHIMAVGDKPA